MKILSTISDYASKIADFGPLKKARSLGRTLLDKITFGRGLKIWSKPAVKEVKSKEDFSEFELANGMKVIFKQSKGTEITASLKFDSGASKDPKGKEGLAHFLEHIVVSNTKEFAKEIDEVVSLNGGFVNAMTGNDFTSYILKLPKDKADLSMRILRAYMSELNYDQKTLEKEKGIVSAELKMMEAKSSRKAGLYAQEMLFGKGHPLTKDPGGTSKAVQSLTKTDLDEFYSNEYVPNNATLTISGDIDKVQFKNLVSRYFAPIKANPNLKKIDASKGIKSSEQKVHELKDDTLVSSLDYIYKVPKFNHKDELITSLLEEALSGGYDSRLKKKLVDGGANSGKAVVLGVSASANINKDYGHFSIHAKPLDENREANLRLVKKVVDEELNDISQNGLEKNEFERLIRVLENREIFKKDSQHADLSTVGSYSQNGEDWTLGLNYLDDLKKITNEDIKNYVQKYLLTNANRHELKITGSGKGFNADYKNSLKDKTVDAKGDKHELLSAEKLDHIKSLSRGVSNLDAKITGLDKIQTQDGMQVFLKEDHSLPVIMLKSHFDGGSLAVDEKDKTALSFLDSILSETGTYNPKSKRRLTKQDIEKLEIELGANIDQNSYVTEDRSGIGFSVLSKNLNKGLGLMNEILNNPALLDETNPVLIKELEAALAREKKSRLDMMKIFAKMPAVKASQKLINSMYPKGHFFAAKIIPEVMKEVQNITLDDLRRIYKQIYNINPSKVSVVGDITKGDLDQKVLPVLRSFSKENPPSNTKQLDYKRMASVDAPKSSFSVVSSDNNEPESTVMMGNPAEITEESDDYHAALIANKILGAGMSSRLFSKVREENGLVYHISSDLMPLRKACAPFTISFGCDPRNVKKSITATLATVKDFLKQGVTKEELELAKSKIKKSFAMGALNSRSGTCGLLSDVQLKNKDEKFINNFSQMIDAISLEQVNATARKFIKPQNFTIVATKPKDFKIEEDLVETKKETEKNANNMQLVA